jgi:hypothetical protein
VADDQVRRDHLLSHLLAALSMRLVEQIVFYGGTALARTHLPDGRLSEDLDLLAIGRRKDVVEGVEDTLAKGVRRAYGRLAWDPPLRAVRSAEPAVLVPLTASRCESSCSIPLVNLDGQQSAGN